MTRWITVTLVASLVATLDGGWLAGLAGLAPAQIFRGQLWRLVTWALIQTDPLSLVFTCVAIYKFGGELAVRWGDRRLRRYITQLVVGGAVVTCLLAAATGWTHLSRLGGWAVSDALVIAWARQFPDATLVLYQVLELRGPRLVAVTFAVTMIYALYMGPIAIAPELVACAAAVYYPPGWLRRS